MMEQDQLVDELKRSRKVKQAEIASYNDDTERSLSVSGGRPAVTERTHSILKVKNVMKPLAV